MLRVMLWEEYTERTQWERKCVSRVSENSTSRKSVQLICFGPIEWCKCEVEREGMVAVTTLDDTTSSTLAKV